VCCFFFQAEDGIRDLVRSRGLGDVYKRQKHPEYEDYKEWLPKGFKPHVFPLKAVNAELASFGAWHRKHPRKKSTPWHFIY